ncbi:MULTISPECIES: ornithine cyclodeaminase family protein [Phyllobacterium]|jgi:ornithine cyclodeaminase/alanine dehydrogenase-like protein (mu-crystallin family)|uniref:Ornithine cyclodeaminase n=1 Tax=Phyllobacterium sophorae TaxID=1520277 RepID=A0A2P7BLW3_9HYPH|nr:MULTISPECIES: ornithine cyclodeaminase family protein [Phyllobacterium]PSH67420.1 ornithine cyclodeaminase [Phyllobacterium sophorae]UXN65629.1 ornithine cyclodeaminase family protein [Phyllobacterium sp. A18/5-2]
MKLISPAEVDALLSWPDMIAAIEQAFRQGVIQPVRHHHTVERPDGAASTLLLMPAWSDFDALGDSSKGYMGVKIVTVSPDNGAVSKPAVMGVYLLLDGKTGEPRALIDGQRLTLWRTAGASALAARYLAREDASKLVVIGAGALSGFLARAHSAVRPIDQISIWNRSLAGAEKVAAELVQEGFNARAVDDKDAAIAAADIITAGTLSTEPLILGKHLKPGTHVDLIGAFTPTMRESDDECVKRARVFVDTKDGAMKEGGDIVQPIKAGVVTTTHVIGDLFDLTRGTVKGRQSAGEITLFKSVGAALEDLAAGILVYEKAITASS